MSKKPKTTFVAQERIINLLEPVRIYTALELAVMPLSKMNAAIEAQEKFYLLEHTTKMGGASHSSTPPNTGWLSTHSSQRKIKNSLQNQQRFYRTTDCPSAGNTRPCKIGS